MPFMYILCVTEVTYLKMNQYKRVVIKSKTTELIECCRKEFLRVHPEFAEIPISYNKIIYEMAKFYLNN